MSSQLSHNSSLAWIGIWRAGQKVRQWISWDHTSDRPVWEQDGSGNFTTRSAYMGLRENIMKVVSAVRGETSDSRSTRAFWNKLWRLKMQGKVKFFIWKLFHDYLPTSGNLLKKGCAGALSYASGLLVYNIRSGWELNMDKTSQAVREMELRWVVG
ncbi:hypothetical protein QQ045_020975 [Rhodiola kirilowii]